MAAGAKAKAAIPAWQQAHQGEEQEVRGEKETELADAGEAVEGLSDSNAPEVAEAEQATSEPKNGSSSADADSALQLDKVKTFLEDVGVRDAPVEKKRAFLESKGVAPQLIDQVLGPPRQTNFASADFESFKHAQSQASIQMRQPAPKERAPPIITYPEFLVEAHKPSPLVTVERLLNAGYVVGGFGALLYGASKFLVAPMSDSLNEARHDFAMHSQSKIEEMNSRLSKLASKEPDTRKSNASKSADLSDEEDSLYSDPTELYHRDIGVQTSPPRSPALSSADGLSPGSDPQQRDPVHSQTETLKNIHSHLDDLIEHSTRVDIANRDRQDATDKLQVYLDGLMYATPAGMPMWSPAGTEAPEPKHADQIDELKKEIRGVKGVLLSAKRFPTATVR